MTTVTHSQKVRPNPFSPGEFTNGTLCNRVMVCAVGMNLSDKPAEVTCKLCLKRMKGWPAAKAA